MTFSEFTLLISKTPDGFVLLEGRRRIPADVAVQAEALARALAVRFPRLRFRSGNATGTDEAFSNGIASTAPGRLHVVSPYSSHRKAQRVGGAMFTSPETLSFTQDTEMAFKTKLASPKSKGLIDKRSQKGALAAKAAYLIRDTMKVTGCSADFPKAVCALFFVELNNPLAGGTGHTIRVCQQEGVPYAFQDSWLQWPR